jgi:hypothetical protein
MRGKLVLTKCFEITFEYVYMCVYLGSGGKTTGGVESPCVACMDDDAICSLVVLLVSYIYIQFSHHRIITLRPYTLPEYSHSR